MEEYIDIHVIKQVFMLITDPRWQTYRCSFLHFQLFFMFEKFHNKSVMFLKKKYEIIIEKYEKQQKV